jgi:hypothetical protein
MPTESYKIPHPGPEFSLPSWSAIVNRDVRRRIPEVRATRAGRSIVWRYKNRSATFAADGETWRATFSDSSPDAGPTLGRIHFARRDSFTAANLAVTLAAFFDDRFACG